MTSVKAQIIGGSLVAIAGLVGVLLGQSLLGWFGLMAGLTVAFAHDSLVVRIGGAFIASLIVVGVAHQGPAHQSSNEPAASTAPSPSTPSRQREKMVQLQVIADDLGDEWPLTVPRGFLRCEADNEVSFELMDGTIYRVNGLARYPGIEPIWAADPDPAMAGVDARKSLSPLIDMGLTLCKQLE